MTTITDEVLTQLLDEAASSYDVPEHGPDDIVTALADQPAATPLVRRRWVQLSSAACLVVGALFALTAFYGVRTYDGNLSGSVEQDADDSVAASDQKSARREPFVRGRNGTADSLAPKAALPVPAAQSAPVFTGLSSRSSGGGSSGGGGGAGSSGNRLTSGTSGGTAAGLAPAPNAAFAPPAVAAPQVEVPTPDEGSSRVVKSGSISLVVGDKKVSSTLTAVQRAAKAQGGYISASSSDEYGDTPSGEVTIRVPVARFENLVAAVRGLNAKVRTASTSGKDVTAQFADVESQLRTLKATRERFLLILGKANTIGEILTVQQRVDSVTGQIDRLEGQRKLLASQSDLSTLAVSVSEEGDPVVKATDRPRSGLSQAFRDAGHGFIHGVEAIIRHSGRVLLLLICLALALVVGRVGWRVARRRMV